MDYSWRYGDKLWVTVGGTKTNYDYSWRCGDKLWITVGGTETNYGLQLEVQRLTQEMRQMTTWNVFVRMNHFA